MTAAESRPVLHDPSCAGCGHCCAQAPPSWQIGRFRFERQADPVRRWHRWGCSDGSYGAANCATPFGAFLAQRHWRRRNLGGLVPPRE